MSDKKGFSLKSLFVEETPEIQTAQPIPVSTSVPSNPSDFEDKAIGLATEAH